MILSNKAGYFYVASPYTDTDPKIRARRYEAVEKFAAFLCLQRVWAFVPIMHSHHMGLKHKLPYEFEFWNEWNQAMIRPSRGVIVFEIEGWDESRGIAAELEFAETLKLPIFHSKSEWPDYDHTV